MWGWVIVAYSSLDEAYAVSVASDTASFTSRDGRYRVSDDAIWAIIPRSDDPGWPAVGDTLFVSTALDDPDYDAGVVRVAAETTYVGGISEVTRTANWSKFVCHDPNAIAE